MQFFNSFFAHAFLLLGTITHSHAMLRDVNILSINNIADNYVVKGATYFKIHSNNDCKKYRFTDEYTTRIKDKDQAALFGKLKFHTHVISYHNASWEMIAIILMGRVDPSNEQALPKYARKHLDPKAKIRPAKALIQRNQNWIKFFDEHNKELLSLPYQAPEKIVLANLNEFQTYFNLSNIVIEEDFVDLTNVELVADSNENVAKNCCISCILF